MASDDAEKKEALYECVRASAQMLLASAALMAGRIPPQIQVTGNNNIDGTQSIEIHELEGGDNV